FVLFFNFVKNKIYDLRFLTSISILFRVVFLLAIPNLSQDFYRFIWDGRMILEGFNPYLYTVESFLMNSELPVNQAQELYDGMGALNASHYTNYPPINQLCFVIAGLFAGKSILGSVVVMRILIITADIGTLHFGKKLLERLNLPVHNIFWYILNPFIIIELTGNLHFEGVMIFFLVWSLYLLHKGKWQWAAVVFALSVSVKLIPLIFLPLFYQWFTKEKSKLNWIPAFPNTTRLVGFHAIVGTVTLLFFLPFYSRTFVTNYAETVGLWFQKFEFNASLYYIAREIGYTFRGYNEIAIIGRYIPWIVIGFVLLLALFRKNKTLPQLITAMLLALSFYFFTATTVHPWYITTLLLFSVFTNYRFPLVWSFVIILSYLAYANDANKENLWIIGLEYVIVYAALIWDLLTQKFAKLKA
ncbi:MAG: mannosyltransferase, partial [Flavobacteriaceae bacterium]|nr:mannosyltransferase [Flavobacteriaceae bacterium]